MNVSAALVQAQSMVDSEGDGTEWSKNIVRITGFAQETAGSFASQYNETAWFPVARDTFSRYMEVWASRRGVPIGKLVCSTPLKYTFVIFLICSST